MAKETQAVNIVNSYKHVTAEIVGRTMKSVNGEINISQASEARVLLAVADASYAQWRADVEARIAAIEAAEA